MNCTLQHLKIIYFLPFITFLLLIYSCNLNVSEDKNQEDPYNGVRKHYSKSGKLLSAITYKDSMPNGPAWNYYENGKVQAEFNYSRGVKHGEEKVFYENGDLYQSTQWVNGSKSGIQKKYYPGNRLMAEIPYKNNQLIPGLKEYNKSGTLKNEHNQILFKLIDKSAFENKFELKMWLSNESKVTKFEQFFLDENGNELGTVPVEAEKGIGVISFILMPGKSIMKRVHVRSTRKTTLGNLEILEGTYNLAIHNKKNYF